ncbi:Ig-like domain-containing protein [Cerasicoccus maritimus]|uniref:Ig-like domain-containing protein n=1 Tax=Cerasicoccus maritimus TaxID=490089 RepID=UPI00285279D7|nr:Ig-like domain-containing protein [Cerasicoccus maritimus]
MQCETNLRIMSITILNLSLYSLRRQWFAFVLEVILSNAVGRPCIKRLSALFGLLLVTQATAWAGENENLDLGAPDYPDVSVQLSPDFAKAHPIYSHNMRNGEAYLQSAGSHDLTPQQWADLVPEQVPSMTSDCPNCGNHDWQFDFNDPDHITCAHCSEQFPDNDSFPEQTKVLQTPWGTETAIQYYEDSEGNVYYLRGQLDTCRFETMQKGYLDLARAWFQNKDTDPEKAAYYAERVQAVLLEYAKVYPTYLPVDEYNRIYYDTGAPGVLDGQEVEDWRPAYPHTGSLWVRWPWTGSIPSDLAYVYDICYASPGMDDTVPGWGQTLRELIEDRIFDTAVDYVQAYEWTFHIRGNTQSHFRKVAELAAICGRPDYARYVRDVIAYSESMYDLGWDAVSTQGPWYHRLWMSNPVWASYALAHYSDPVGYVDEDGVRLDYFDPRTSPNMQRLNWNWRSLILPDGNDLPWHDAADILDGPYLHGLIGETQTRILPGLGQVVLADGAGDEQVEAHLHWSGGNNHAHMDMLNLYLWGHGRELFGDRLSKSSAQHSLVYVDGNAAYRNDLSHDNRGNLEWYTPNFRGISITRTDGLPGMQHDNGSTRANRYRRTIALNTMDLAHPYVLDVFEVAGGSTHDYRLVGSAHEVQSFSTNFNLQNDADIQSLGLSETVSGPLDKSGYVELSFDSDPSVGTRSHFFQDESTELIIARGEALFGGASGNSAQIVLRREDSAGNLESTFVAVHELKNGASSIQSVEQEWLGANTLGVTITTTSGRSDYYLLSFSGQAEMSYGPVSANAQCAMASIHGDNTDLWMVGGVSVSANGKTLTSSVAEFTGAVSSPTRRQDGDSQDSFLTDAGLPVGEELAGEVALLEFCDVSGNVIFVNGFTVLNVVQEGAEQRVVVKEDVAFTIDGDTVIEGYKNWREAHHINLRMANSVSSIPTPKLLGDDLFFPLEFTPEIALTNGGDFEWMTNGDSGNTQISVDGGAFAAATATSTYLAPSNLASTVRITEENADGVYPSVINEYQVFSMFPAQSVAVSLREGIWISEYQGVDHPGLSGVVSESDDWGTPATLRNVAQLSNPLTANTYSAMKAEGYLDIPTTGLYTFYFHCGGGRLWIDDTLVVDSARVKDSHLYIPLKLYLEQGLHKLDTETFEGYDTNELSLDWEGPGIERETISAEYFRSAVDPNNPDNPVTHSLSVTHNANGSVLPANAVELAEGASQTFTFMSDFGYQVADVVVDGVSVGAVVAYTFSDVTTAHSIQVTFEPAFDLPASSDLLVNGSFESGAANFNFTDNAGDLPLTLDMVGQWITREKNEDRNMDFADISSNINGQDGSVSMLFQSAYRRGLVQVVDVSQMNLSGRDLVLSVSFVAPGRGELESDDMACYQVVGFNDFTDLTVDIGGSYGFSGGNYDKLMFKRRIADAELSESTYTVFSETISVQNDYNYIAVLVGGLAGSNNDDAQYVAVDNVMLAIKTASNTPPVAYDGSASVAEGDSVVITLTGSDQENDSLTYSVSSAPSHGELSGAAPNLTYTPSAGYSGADSFTFTVDDGQDISDPATVTIAVIAAPQPSLNLLVNGSFESGAANFNFTGNAGDLPLTVDMIGQWLTREVNEDSNMDLADISSIVSGQDGSVSMLFQSTSKRGLVQIVDVTAVDLSGKELTFSASFATPGRELQNLDDVGCYQIVGFNSFTDLSVDIGGRYAFTGGAFDDLVAKRRLTDAELSGSDYTVFQETVALVNDYDYIAVLVGGLAGAKNSDSQFAAVDHIQLNIDAATETVGVLSVALAVTDIGEDTDADNDGWNDADEIALGTDPHDPSSVFAITSCVMIPESGMLRIGWPSVSGVQYRVWISSDLIDWTVARDWENAVSPPEDILDLEMSSSNLFFKVEADIP